MALDDNPWIGVLTQPQSNCIANIISYFTSQGKMLSDASSGKIQGVFARTNDANRSLSPIVNMGDLALGVAQVIEKLGMVYGTPDVVLLDTDDMYKVENFCFEVRSDRYRFRLLLGSEKLNYICGRLMNEPKNAV